MEAVSVERIKNDPKFQKLVKTRNRFAFTLTGIMLLAYYGYVGLIAFDKELLAKPLGSGVMSVGIPVGFGLIVFTMLITWFYVRRANSEFDVLKDEIVKDVQK